MLTQFAIRLICGMSLVWCVMPRSEVTSGFFRIQNLVTLGLSVLALMAIGPASIAEGAEPTLSVEIVRWISVGLATMSFLGSVMWTLERRAAGTRFAFGIAAVSLLTVVLSSVPVDGFLTLKGNLTWLTELTVSAVSGATVGGMLLGHWYLTTPTMSTTPLNRVNWFLCTVAGGRLTLGAIALGFFWPFGVDGPAAIRSTVLNSYPAMCLMLEWIGGILGPLAVSIMVVRILKYKNTQSATGVLFVGVILAFIGEMTGALLRQELQLPL
ncbi:MAG: hypothetical protein O3B13_12945 [Planctomycetota bacterium]|nr:hypothetical protein [Planctomycetota bacterium]MDA1164005.1 hypothetical protein [Planctomycetota bacterium]